MIKSVLYSTVMVFCGAYSEYSLAGPGDCVNTSGNQVADIYLGNITLSQSTNTPNHILYDKELSSTLLTAVCDCDENSYASHTRFSGDKNSYSSYVDNWNGFNWYSVPGFNYLAYSLEVDVYDESYSSFRRLNIPFSGYSNHVPESNCRGPSTLSSLTKGRLQIRLLRPVIGIENFDAPLGYFKMRREQTPTSSTPIIRRLDVRGSISSGHYCGVTGSNSVKHTFRTGFLTGFDDQIPSKNSSIPPLTTVVDITCNYSSVPVEIEFTGDFSTYGLKTNLDGVEIKSILSANTFGTNYIINNTTRKFQSSLDLNGLKRVQFSSGPILTKPQSQVTLGEYSATMYIRVNFK
ncbi:TPA: hypothetical protein ACVU4W_004614 [Vibrio parahaemolyticus]